MSEHSRAAASPRQRGELLGALLIVLMSLQFGSVVVLGRIATRAGGLPVPSLLAIRFALAAGLLAAAVAALRRPLAPARGEARRLAALGMAGYAVEAGLFFTGLSHGTAAAVTLLFYTYPVLVSVIAFLLGRGLPGWTLGGALASAVAGAAIVVVAGGGVDIDGTGVAFALGASVVFSLYLVGAETVLDRTNSLAGAMWVSGAAAVGLAAFAVATGSADWPEGWRQWGPVLGMAAFTSGAFVCLFAGLRRIGAVRTAILSSTEPLSAAVLAGIFLGESVSVGTLFGGALIVAGVVAASLARRGPADGAVP